MTPSPDLAALIEIIAADPVTERALADEKSNDALALACAALAEMHSLRVTADEVRALLRARTLIWMQRHIL
jgi:hypothetical protein